MHGEPVLLRHQLQDGRHLRLASFPTQAGGALVVVIDETAGRSAEAQVRDRLEEIVESLAEGVALYDADLRLSMEQQRSPPPCPWRPSPMAYGTHITEHCRAMQELGMLALPDGVTTEAFTAAVVAATRAHAQGIEIAMADGAVLEASSYPTPGGGYLCTLRDITERKHRDRSDALMRTIVECLGDGLALYDGNLRLQMNNPAFRRIVFNDLPLSEPGLSVVEEMRRSIAAGVIPVPEGGADAVVEWMLDCIRNTRVGIELPMSDGRTIEASNFAAPGGGRIILMSGRERTPKGPTCRGRGQRADPHHRRCQPPRHFSSPASRMARSSTWRAPRASGSARSTVAGHSSCILTIGCDT